MASSHIIEHLHALDLEACAPAPSRRARCGDGLLEILVSSTDLHLPPQRNHRRCSLQMDRRLQPVLAASSCWPIVAAGREMPAGALRSAVRTPHMVSDCALGPVETPFCRVSYPVNSHRSATYEPALCTGSSADSVNCAARPCVCTGTHSGGGAASGFHHKHAVQAGRRPQAGGGAAGASGLSTRPGSLHAQHTRSRREN